MYRITDPVQTGKTYEDSEVRSVEWRLSDGRTYWETQQKGKGQDTFLGAFTGALHDVLTSPLGQYATPVGKLIATSDKLSEGKPPVPSLDSFDFGTDAGPDLTSTLTGGPAPGIEGNLSVPVGIKWKDLGLPGDVDLSGIAKTFGQFWKLFGGGSPPPSSPPKSGGDSLPSVTWPGFDFGKINLPSIPDFAKSLPGGGSGGGGLGAGGSGGGGLGAGGAGGAVSVTIASPPFTPDKAGVSGADLVAPLVALLGRKESTTAPAPAALPQPAAPAPDRSLLWILLAILAALVAFLLLKKKR